jgi:hypothetical protein
VRIFPLFALDGGRSALVSGVLQDLNDAGFSASIRTVNYEFQRGATEMM